MNRLRSLLLRAFRLLPQALEAFDHAHLKWARASLSKHNPLHPDLPAIVLRLAEMEDRRG
jgi:hypothetical protein